MTLTPDYTNIMSYFERNCYNHFTSDQQTEIMDKNLYFHPNRTFLRNNIACPTPLANYGVMNARFCDETNFFNRILPINYNVNFQKQNTGITYPLLVTGAAHFYSPSMPDGGNLIIQPTKNSDYLNGVTTFDVSLISAHLVDNPSFINAYTKIAADVNYDGEIDASDMLFIRDLVLRRRKTFPNGVGSWRFVPQFYFATSTNNFENNFKAFQANPFALTYTNGTITKNYLDTGNGSYLDKVSLDVTTSVGKNPVNWSFNPLKMGDVNCSASNSSAARMLPASMRYPMTTNIKNTDLPAQSTKTLVLKAQYAGKVSSFQLGFKLTPTKLQIKNVLKGDLNSTNDEFDFEKTDNGELRALWYNNKGKNINFTEGVILMKIKVNSLSNIQDVLNELKLDDAIVQNEFYDEKGNTASVKLSLEIDNNSSINDGNPYIIKVYPNPFNNDLTFDINVPKSEDATISIYNSFGGIVYTSKQTLNLGSNLIKISNAPSFPVGSFSYRIQTPTQVLNGYLNKTR